MPEETSLNPVELATEITIAWLNNPNNRVAAEEVPAFLRSMHAAVNELASGAATEAAAEVSAPEFTPAVSVRKSLASRDHILSLIDGKPYKTLTRHLTGHGLTPAEYRSRYNLRADYPMVSEAYSENRREMAKRIGLGRRPAAVAEAPATLPVEAAPVQAPLAKSKAPVKRATATAKAGPVKAVAATSIPPKAKAATPKKKLGIAAPKPTTSEGFVAEEAGKAE